MQFHKLFCCLSLAAALLVGCDADKKPATAKPPTTSAPFNLVGTNWALQEINGSPIVPNSAPSLAFMNDARVSGSASCNRFTGAVTITGDQLKFGPLATTMMACISDSLSKQEMSYLAALNKATRYEWKDPNLLIYVEGAEKPLRFTRAPDIKP